MSKSPKTWGLDEIGKSLSMIFTNQNIAESSDFALYKLSSEILSEAF